MPGRSWTPTEIARLRTLVEMGTPRDHIARDMGRNLNSVRLKAMELGLVLPASSTDRRLKPKSQRSKHYEAPPAEPTPTTEKLDRDRTGDVETFTSVSRTIRTVDDLVDAANIDRRVWVEERVKVNSWEGFAKNDAGEIIKTQLYQINATFRRDRALADMHTIAETLLAEIAAASPVREAPAIVRPLRDRHMLEVCIMDLHMGKLAWHEETGEDYDLGIAETLAARVLEDLLAKAQGFPVERIVVPIGNDLVQVDNGENTTTAGTRQDTDSRYAKIFTRTERLLVRMLDRLAQVAPVEGIVVPGNHDRITAFTLGRVLEAHYRNDQFVTVDSSPKLRKYFRYGCTLLGFTHGCDEKHGDLPLIMAQECPRDWAETTHREFHVGHYHKRKETRYTAGDSFNGVRVTVIPSLSAADAWHYSKGYVGEKRAAHAYLWSHDDGYAGHFSSAVRPAERLRNAA